MEKGRQWTAAEILSVFQIAVLLLVAGGGFARIEQALSLVTSTSKRLDRIEHYLSSKDVSYWRLSKDAE